MRFLLTSSVAALLLSALTSAQIIAPCPIADDGLHTGGCCDPVKPSLPNFPAFESRALWFCLTDCKVEDRAKAELSVSQPFFFDCDRARYEAKFNVDFGGGAVFQWRGRLIAKYSRTFVQISSTGRRYQVWRFIVNGDFSLLPTVVAPSQCQVPPCLGLFQRVHFVGHIDYACRPAGGFDVAMSLQHLPGCISHGLLSARPAPSHPDRSYYLVAPDAFLPGVNQGTEPQGTILGEELRVSDFSNQQCFSEIRLTPEDITSIFKDCPCVGGGGALPWDVQKTALIGGCGGIINKWLPQAIGPVVPPGLNLQTVGQWALPAGTFPERQTLVHYQTFVATDSLVVCNPRVEPKQLLYGVGIHGNRTFGFGPSFSSFDNAEDLVSSVDGNQKFFFGAPSFADLQFGLFIR